MSRAAAPARKADALIGALVELDRSEIMDDLALNRLAREAQALMKSDATGARIVLGGIAGIEGDGAKSPRTLRGRPPAFGKERPCARKLCHRADQGRADG